MYLYDAKKNIINKQQRTPYETVCVPLHEAPWPLYQKKKKKKNHSPENSDFHFSEFALLLLCLYVAKF